MNPENHQAIVVGVGNGLGRSLALRLAKEHFDLVLISRTEENLRSVADEIRSLGRAASTVSCDAADPEAVAATVAGLAERGPVRILAYNAVAVEGRLIDADPQNLQRATNINVLSPIAATRAALPALERTGGAVLLTGGGLALYPSAAFGVLSLGKAGIRAAAHLLADDLRPSGVRVRTLTIAGMIEPGGPFDPDTVADAFWSLYADESDEVERVYAGPSSR